MSGLEDPSARAFEAWGSLSRACLRPADGGALAVRMRPGRRALAHVWPVSQVLAAAIDLAELTGDLVETERLVTGLRVYAAGDGYLPLPGDRLRYYDDNAWLGLCFAQLHLQTGEARWLRRARKVFRFVREGQDPDGGMRWVERRRARHTCSAAPAAQLALRLHLADGSSETLTFARRTLAWLDRTLLMRGGLYADHVDPRGVNRALRTYNQGAAVGANLLLHLATGDEGPLDRARTTAAASLRRFGPDRTWKHQPVFNAVWFRNLLALDTLARVEGLRPALDAYLVRAWRAGRDADGLFTAGGIGSYDGTPAIDSGGLVQLYALRAWPRDQLANVC
ncbi:MAG TPA: glycoside hydrolase family 76 protein [Actinomycetota bacterium]|nr:glycoside hydrolase family 76 protein [Actinomycetota bacterium]